MTAKARRGGRPTAAEARELTVLINAAATQLFLESGYQETTFERVARKAGTTKNAVYTRYPEKPDLFAAVCKGLVVDAYRENIIQIEDNLPLEQSLLRVSERLLDAATRPRAMEMYRLICDIASRHPEIAQSAEQSWSFYVEQIETYFRSRINRGLLLLRDPRGAAEILAEMLFARIHLMLVHNKPIPDRDQTTTHIRRTVMLFLGGIGRLEIGG